MKMVLHLLLLTLPLASGRAEADTWDIKAGLGPVYGSTFRTDERDGVGFSAYADLGLTETLSVACGAGYAHHFIGDGESYSIGHAGLGILYNIDVLEVVPFLSLRIGWLMQAPQEAEATSGLGITAAIGFDYLWSDHFTLGFAAEYHGMLTDWQLFPAYVGFTGRVGFRLPD